MEGLSLDNILTDNDIDNLFVEDNNSSTDTQQDVQETEEKEEKSDTAEVDVNTLFDDSSESVGSEEKQDIEKEDTDSKQSGTSPIYSSIAKALKEEGVFPDLEDDTLKGLNSPEDFVNMFQDQVDKRLNYQQQRVIKALNANVQPDAIKNYEGIINYLNNLSEGDIREESETGEQIRKNLIYQDFLNRGFDNEKAQKFTMRSVENGTDVDDALEALESNKKFYNKTYNGLIQQGIDNRKKFEEERKAQAEQLKKAIMEDKNFFGELEVDKKTRNQIYHNIAVPSYKDPETGVELTAIQKYQKDNPNDFLKNLSLVYTLTDGFKRMDKFVKQKVKKEVSKGMKQLEESLFNTSRNGGDLTFASGVSDDGSESIWQNYVLDV